MKPNIIFCLLYLFFSSETSYADAFPIPVSQTTSVDLRTFSTPRSNDALEKVRPLGIKTAKQFTATLGTPEFSKPVDIYVMFIWSDTPNTAYSVNKNMSLSPIGLNEVVASFSSGTQPSVSPFRSGVMDPVNETVLTFASKDVPHGGYTSHVFVTPANNGLSKHYHWINSFSIDHSPPPPKNLHRACNIESDVLEDLPGHHPFVNFGDQTCHLTIPFPTNRSGPASIEIPGFATLDGNLEIETANAFDPPTRTLIATGTGTAAGFQNISMELEATSSENLLFTRNRRMTNCNLPDPADWNDFLLGTLSIGTNGGLPGGLPIIYSIRIFLPLTTSSVIGSASAGSSWLMITGDKDAVVNCSITSPTNTCENNGIADSNFSDTSTIVSRYNVNPSFFDVSKSYFHFSLPELPPGTTIEDAFINLYDVENMITPSQDSVPVGYSLGPWTTELITWNNQPNPYFDGYLNYSIGPFINQFKWRGHSNSIATYINSIYSGTMQNNGFVLGTGSGHHARGFRSVNTGFDAPRLYLRVNSTTALDASNVSMPSPPSDMEIASQLFICEGSSPPADTQFSAN